MVFIENVENESKIVHYMHLNKLWYYWIDKYSDKKYWRKFEGKCDDVKLLTEEIITERQCKIKLKDMFPCFTIMKAIPYHYSPDSDGSRPVKCTIDRKGMIKEKDDFRKELEKCYLYHKNTQE